MKAKNKPISCLPIFGKILLILFFLQIAYVFALKWVEPPLTLTQLKSLMKNRAIQKKYVPWEDISPYAKMAVIAAEDKNFLKHQGFDPYRIEKAIEASNRNGDLPKGASTISQQTAKNVFLWQGRNWLRKGLEAYFTGMIERLWGKKRILEVYLNVAEMGEGIFGIEAASQHYFHKSAKDLTPSEAAMIAASLPNPKVYTIDPLNERITRYYPRILKSMRVMSYQARMQDFLQISAETIVSKLPEEDQNISPTDN